MAKRGYGFYLRVLIVVSLTSERSERVQMPSAREEKIRTWKWPCNVFLLYRYRWNIQIKNNKHLMTGSEGNSSFCCPRISMFPRGAAEGNKMSCFPRDQSLSDLLYSTKRKTCNGNSNGGRQSTLGSLSNDNGDGNDNVISKYKFALF